MNIKTAKKLKPRVDRVRYTGGPWDDGDYVFMGISPDGVGIRVKGKTVVVDHRYCRRAIKKPTRAYGEPKPRRTVGKDFAETMIARALGTDAAVVKEHIESTTYKTPSITTTCSECCDDVDEKHVSKCDECFADGLCPDCMAEHNDGNHTN